MVDVRSTKSGRSSDLGGRHRLSEGLRFEPRQCGMAVSGRESASRSAREGWTTPSLQLGSANQGGLTTDPAATASAATLRPKPTNGTQASLHQSLKDSPFAVSVGHAGTGSISKSAWTAKDQESKKASRSGSRKGLHGEMTRRSKSGRSGGSRGAGGSAPTRGADGKALGPPAMGGVTSGVGGGGGKLVHRTDSGGIATDVSLPTPGRRHPMQLSPLQHVNPSSMDWEQLRQLSEHLGVEPRMRSESDASKEPSSPGRPVHSMPTSPGMHNGRVPSQSRLPGMAATSGLAMLQGSTEVLRLQAYVEELRSDLEHERDRAADAERQASTMTRKLGLAHAEFARELQARDEQQERVVLSLERHFAARLSKLQSAMRGEEFPGGGLDPVSMASLPESAARVAGQADQVVDAATDVFTRLASTMEEQDDALREWEKERAGLQKQLREARDTMQRAHSDLDRKEKEFEDRLRESSEGLERQLATLGRELAAAQERENATDKRSQELSELLDKTEARADEAERALADRTQSEARLSERAEAAEKRLRAIQESAVKGEDIATALRRATSGEESSAESSTVGDPVVALVEAKQLLKQLQAESEELRQEGTKLRERADAAEERARKAAKDASQALAAAHREHSREIDALHAHADAASDAHKDEVKTLESKMQRLQSTVMTSAEELRQLREEIDRARLDLDQAKEAQARAEERALLAEKKVSDMTVAMAVAPRDRLSPTSPSTGSMSFATPTGSATADLAAAQAEARKAANEASYLRSQWEEEVACRQKLEEALEAAHSMLMEERKARESALQQARIEAEAERETAEAGADEARNRLDEVRTAMAAVEAENKFLKRRVDDLQGSVDVAEERSQMNEDEVGRLRSAVSTLEEALHAATNEATAVKSAATDAERRHIDSLQAAKKAVEDTLRRSESRLASVQEELTETRAKLAESRAERTRDKMESKQDMQRRTKLVAAERLTNSLQQWCNVRCRDAMRQWLDVAWLDRAEEMSQEARDAGVRAAEVEAEQQRKRALEALETRLEGARKLQVSTLTREYSTRLRATEAMAFEDRRASLLRAAEMERARIEVTKEQLASVFGDEAVAMRVAYEEARETMQKTWEDRLREEEQERERERQEAAELLEAERERLEGARVESVEQALAQAEEAHSEAMSKMVESMQTQMEETIAQLIADKDAERDREVADVIADWEDRLRETTDDWAERYEAMEQKLEGQLALMEADKDEWKAECTKSVQAVERFRRAAALWRMYLFVIAGKSVAQRRSLTDRIAALEKQRRELYRRINVAEQEVQYLERTYVPRVRELEEMRSGMRDNLTASKREQLMTHKVEGTRLQGKLARLEELEHELETEREELETWVQRHEETVRAKETELRETSEQSNITADGRVDMAVARKKRRLHTEHTNAVARLTEARAKVAGCVRRQGELEEQRADIMREVQQSERALIGLMMEQQKGLLAILKATGEPEFDTASRSVEDHRTYSHLVASGSHPSLQGPAPALEEEQRSLVPSAGDPAFSFALRANPAAAKTVDPISLLPKSMAAPKGSSVAPKPQAKETLSMQSPKSILRGSTTVSTLPGASGMFAVSAGSEEEVGSGSERERTPKLRAARVSFRMSEQEAAEAQARAKTSPLQVPTSGGNLPPMTPMEHAEEDQLDKASVASSDDGLIAQS
jgi:hypothetical protein